MKVNKSYSELWDDILRSRCLLQYYTFNEWQRETGSGLRHSAADLSKAVKNVGASPLFFTSWHHKAVMQ